MSRYYLDTNILIFFLINEDELSRSVKRILSDYTNIFYTSSICVIEALQLIRIGKVRLNKAQRTSGLLKLLYEAGIEIKPHTEKHLLLLSSLDTLKNHSDPFDHSIIAQAISDKIEIISSDSKFEFYREQGLKLVLNKR